MTKKELLARLRELHEELSEFNFDLSADEHVDEETIEALGQLVTDVGGLVEQAKLGVVEDEIQEEHQNLLDRFAQFDGEHPHVSQFLSQMSDLLGLMGI